MLAAAASGKGVVRQTMNLRDAAALLKQPPSDPKKL
jgi:hypothetical protein